ncbi:MAG: prepilin-type N-terminal cleavage/methylation domain-containing protein [Proteobacteria bacterium]|nr:prepilin-type N-terminal cleavage/methylation domain-containing protein [Pseudomonadota bacterium]
MPIRRRRGFTLLEVLAAVLVMAVIFTALAGAAFRGIRLEADTARRLEASLLADARMAQVESQIRSGALPPIGVEEQEVGEFVVTLEIQPLVLPEELTNALAGEENGAAAGSPNLLIPERNESGVLREIRVTVAWPDGLDTRQTERVTYGIDFEALTPALKDLGLVEEEALEATLAAGDADP